MAAVVPPLLSHWDLLLEHVVPALHEAAAARDERPAVWAATGLSDAVAVALAYRHGHGVDEPGVQVFATPCGGSPSGVRFTAAQLRGLPRPARAEGFSRIAGGWSPSSELAREVLLGPPPGPVDLVVAATIGTGDGLAGHLAPGGHLLLVGDDSPVAPEMLGLEEVAGGPLLRRPPGSAPEAAGEDGEAAQVGDPLLRTLAEKIVEDDMVGRHVNLARGLARRFSGRGESLDDLVQVALVGLVLAARRYEAGHDASFPTYATATILGELKRHFRDKAWMMRVPRHVQETYLAIKTAREELYQELACSPTVPQIAARAGISDEAVLEAIEAGDNFAPMSLDTSVDDEAPGREIPVVDPNYDVVLERKLLVDALPRLAPRERHVLKRVYVDNWTQARVAAEIGVSQMQVSRLVSASIKKVRRAAGE